MIDRATERPRPLNQSELEAQIADLRARLEVVNEQIAAGEAALPAADAALSEANRLVDAAGAQRFAVAPSQPVQRWDGGVEERPNPRYQSLEDVANNQRQIEQAMREWEVAREHHQECLRRANKLRSQIGRALQEQRRLVDRIAALESQLEKARRVKATGPDDRPAVLARLRARVVSPRTS